MWRLWTTVASIIAMFPVFLTSLLTHLFILSPPSGAPLQTGKIATTIPWLIWGYALIVVFTLPTFVRFLRELLQQDALDPNWVRLSLKLLLPGWFGLVYALVWLLVPSQSAGDNVGDASINSLRFSSALLTAVGYILYITIFRMLSWWGYGGGGDLFSEPYHLDLHLTRQGPIYYETNVTWAAGGSRTQLPDELLSSGIGWCWESSGGTDLPHARPWTPLTPENKTSLLGDLGERDSDGYGRHVTLFGVDPDKIAMVLNPTGFHMTQEAFMAREDGPIWVILFRESDGPYDLVFTAHEPTGQVRRLLEVWGITSDAVRRTYHQKKSPAFQWTFESPQERK